jgi:uncharacterized protein DUF2795
VADSAPRRTNKEKHMARGVGGKSPSNVQSYLKGASYPASKADLIRIAQGNGALPEVMGILEGLEDQEFGGPQDVMKAYSAERKEERRA